MKTLTLWQPYASLSVRGIKQFETRSWPTKYRGILLIHAAKKDDKVTDTYTQKILQAVKKNNKARAAVLRPQERGAIIGYVRLTDCIEMTQGMIDNMTPEEKAMGEWRVGRYAWKMDDARVFKNPIISRGNQGLWNYNMSEQEAADLAK